MNVATEPSIETLLPASETTAVANNGVKLPWWRLSVALFLFSGLVYGGVAVTQALLDPLRFPVRDVIVDGQLHYLKQQDVIDVVAPEVRKGFFVADFALLKEQLMAVPWVADVTLQRVWPDQVFVSIVEHIPFVQWGKEGLISSEGKLFFPPLTPFPVGLPVLEGPVGAEVEMVVFYRTFTTLLAETNLTVKHLAIDERHALSMILSNNLVFLLGRQQSEDHLRRFMQVYHQVIGDHAEQVTLIDLRYPNGFTVRWTQDVDKANKKWVVNG